MKNIILFLSTLFIASLSAASCPQEKLFTTIYAQHLLSAGQYNEPKYKKLRTKESLNEIETQLAYFKKQHKSVDFMSLVSSSVQTDPQVESLKVEDCKVTDTRARIIYRGVEKDDKVAVLILMFKKEDSRWKMGEYGISEMKKDVIKTFTQTIDQSPYLKSFHL